MPRSLRVLLLAALALGLAACESSTEPQVASGSIAFGYTGVVSGSFSAQGRFDPRLSRAFAAALSYFDAEEQEAFVDLSGFAPRTGGGSVDAVDFFFPAAAQPATYSLDAAACADGDGTLLPGCGTAFLLIDATENVTLEEVFVPMTGSLVVTEIASGRMRGTFSGTFARPVDGATVQVTGGQFDVPLLST